MMDMLSYTFMQNALIGGVIVGIITAIIGSLVVVNKMVFLSGGIAHSAYGGIGIAIYFGLPMLLSTSLFCTLIAMFIAMASYNKREDLDILIGLTWAVGMSTGIMLVDLTPGYQADLMSYLFGSLLAITDQDIYYMTCLLLVIVVTMMVFYRDIFAVSYDLEYARLRGVNTKFFYTLILVLSSLTIVIAIKVVGLILVIALLTIPIYIAGFFAKNLIAMMGYSALFSILFTIAGLVLSIVFDLSSGSSIILVGSVCAVGIYLIRVLRTS